MEGDAGTNIRRLLLNGTPYGAKLVLKIAGQRRHGFTTSESFCIAQNMLVGHDSCGPVLVPDIANPEAAVDVVSVLVREEAATAVSECRVYPFAFHGGIRKVGGKGSEPCY